MMIARGSAGGGQRHSDLLARRRRGGPGLTALSRGGENDHGDHGQGKEDECEIDFSRALRRVRISFRWQEKKSRKVKG